jgi:hypothetical protein
LCSKNCSNSCVPIIAVLGILIEILGIISEKLIFSIKKFENATPLPFPPSEPGDNLVI